MKFVYTHTYTPYVARGSPLGWGGNRPQSDYLVSLVNIWEGERVCAPIQYPLIHKYNDTLLQVLFPQPKQL